MSTLRHQMANLVSVPITLMYLVSKKIFYPNGIYFSAVERFSPGVIIDLDRKSKIKFGKRVSIHSGGRISANSGGELVIKDNVSFNVGCIVICKKRVSIGRNVCFGPNVMIYDHDHIIGADDGVKSMGFRIGEVVIEDNAWIGAGTIILRNTHIGKNCVIAAGSVVKGNVPDGTILIQKRESEYRKFE